ncbi:unnamed protein product [Closterium sp. NIES-65]|nr:unnamed protein product [Closterium sp. NIES-65]
MVRRREGYPFSRSPARPSCAASHHPPLTSHRCPPRPSPGCMISPYRPSAALPLRPVRQLLRAVALPLHSHLSPPLSTARRSFFASAMGSWALFGPPSYCLTAGAMGTLVYAVCAGLPVLLVACVGAAVHRLVPNVVSMADYVRRRFGLGARPWQGNTGDRLAHAMARPWLRAVREGEGHKGQRSNAFGSEPQVVMPRSQCVRPVCGVALLWPPSLHPLHAALALPPPTLPPTTWCRCTLPSVLWRASCRQHGGMCTAVTDGACCAATSTHTMRFLPSHSLPPLSLCTQQHHGSPFAVYISLLAVGNMGVAMAAEYTALGDLFHRLLHAPRLPIVMLTAATAMLYTAAGGLYVSIQALASLIFTALLTAHVLLNFPSPLPPLPPALGWSNPRGVEAVLFMPLSLLATTLFNEAMWQRCWASASAAALLGGAALGAGAITAVVGLLGFAGLLAAWSGVYEPEGPDDSGNTILFSLFRGHPWALVAVALLAVTMSESAVDSLQNATVDAVAALLLAHPSCSASSKRRVHDKEGGQGSVQRQEEARLTQVQCTEHVEAGGGAREASQPQHTDPFPLVHRTLLTPSSFPTACPLLAGATTVHAPPASATHPDPVPSALAPPHHGPGLTISSIRALVLILNIPPLLVSLQGFNVLQLFLLVNLINTTSFLPLLLGVLQGPLSRVCITPASSATGCASGLLALVVWAKSQQRPGETYVESLARTFLDAYDYPPYLIAVGFSAVGMAVGPSDSTPLKPQSESSEAPPHGGADAAASHAPASGLPAFQYAHHPHHPPARGAYPPQFPPPPGCPSAVVVVAHGASGGEFPVFSPAPIPGLYMLPPRVPPSPDMVILGYETCAPPTGCCATATLSGVGWLAAIVAFIFCWPLTCLPCCIPQLHEVRLIPQLQEVRLIPQLHEVRLIPQLHEVRLIPPLHEVRLIPPLHELNERRLTLSSHPLHSPHTPCTLLTPLALSSHPLHSPHTPCTLLTPLALSSHPLHSPHTPCTLLTPLALSSHPLHSPHTPCTLLTPLTLSSHPLHSPHTPCTLLTPLTLSSHPLHSPHTPCTLLTPLALSSHPLHSPHTPCTLLTPLALSSHPLHSPHTPCTLLTPLALSSHPCTLLTPLALSSHPLHSPHTPCTLLTPLALSSHPLHSPHTPCTLLTPLALSSHPLHSPHTPCTLLTPLALSSHPLHSPHTPCTLLTPLALSSHPLHSPHTPCTLLTPLALSSHPLHSPHTPCTLLTPLALSSHPLHSPHTPCTLLTPLALSSHPLHSPHTPCTLLTPLALSSHPLHSPHTPCTLLTPLALSSHPLHSPHTPCTLLTPLATSTAYALPHTCTCAHTLIPARHPPPLPPTLFCPPQRCQRPVFGYPPADPAPGFPAAPL